MVSTLPIGDVGLFSYIFISWLTPLIWRMYKKRNDHVTQKDVWDCPQEEGIRVNAERLKCIWMQDVSKYGPEKASFYRVWLKFVWRRVLAGLCIVTLMAVSSFLSTAYLIKLILTYLESSEHNLWYGIGLAVAMALSEFVRVCSHSCASVYGSQTGARFASGLVGLLDDKLLRLKQLQGNGSLILNTFSVDPYRAMQSTYFLAFVLSSPVFLIIVAVFCYSLIGYWFLVAMGTFIVLFLTLSFRLRITKMIRERGVKHIESRVRYMSEILRSIKFIKLYAWENAFKDAVKGERQREQKYLIGSAFIDDIASSIMSVAPTIASVVTLSIYTAAGNDLIASQAFAVIGAMNCMRYVMALLPTALRTIGDWNISMKRVQTILLIEEYSVPSSACLDESNAVEMKHANLSWDSKPDALSCRHTGDGAVSLEQETALIDVTIDVKQGQLMGVCGAVGSGKSALVNAILGRIHHVSGHVAVCGRVAYVGQQAWVYNGTVRENILFGLQYDEQRYLEAIRCCGLEPDLQLFHNGDETEIGEYGIKISGGQKQRINLARAAYSNSDIYLLDDPMSALDTKVGKHVFHACINDLLKDKTVILVTHQLQYMAYCDEVVVLEKGRLAERGHHERLLSSDGIYTDMYRTFEQTAMVMDKTNDKQCLHTPLVEGEKAVVNGEQAAPKSKTFTPNGRDLVKDLKPTSDHGLKEEVAIVTSDASTYVAFIKAAGGWGIVSFAVFLQFLAASSLVFSDWWLSQWIEAMTGGNVTETVSDNTTLYQDPHNSTALPVKEPTSILFHLGSINFNRIYIISLAGIILLQSIKGCFGSSTGGNVTETVSDNTTFYQDPPVTPHFPKSIKGCFGSSLVIKAANTLHRRCLDSVLKAPMSFFESNPAGRILNRFTKDLEEGDVSIPMFLNFIVHHMCFTLVTFIVTSYITLWMLIAIAPVIAFIVFSNRVLSVSIIKIKQLENAARSPLISLVNLTSLGLASITTYGQQSNFYKRCIKHGDFAIMTSFLVEISSSWAFIRISILNGLLTVAASLIFVLSKGTISVTSAGLVLALIGKVVIMIQYMNFLMLEMAGKFTSVQRIHDYGKSLEHEPQDGGEPPLSAWPTEGAVEFKDVAMRYRHDLEMVLRHVSFVIKPREKVGVVGKTGVGKTTLAMCLFRLVDVSEGTILVDGHDVSKLSLKCLRSRIASIPQDPVLFNQTISYVHVYNIDPFSNYTDGEIWEALEKVNMKQKFLQINNGLSAEVEENGDNFSEGERQLICLARAVLRNNKILVLDEATANIDKSTDAMIQETIRTCFADCTVITIAHRLNTVLHSDKIIVMDAGQVVECSPPEELLSNPESVLNTMLAAQAARLHTHL